VNEYLGVLLIVSHDRFFLDKTVDHLFVLPGDGVGEVLDCYGSLSACASDGL
jgi:ABC transport system ATP-binding/permease protein